MPYTYDWTPGAISKTDFPTIKSAIPDVANTMFAGGQLVAIVGQFAEDWLRVAPITAAVAPVSRCVIVSSNLLYAPQSYQVLLNGTVAVTIAAGTTMTGALLYDWVAGRFTTTASATTLDVSTRLRIEQIVGNKASVLFI